MLDKWFQVQAWSLRADTVAAVRELAQHPDFTLANLAVTVTRAGVIVTDDAVITEPVAGTIRVADGATYNTTAGDLINWAIVG